MVKETKFMRCPGCLESSFMPCGKDIEYRCPYCDETFPILSKLTIETIEDFINHATDENLYLVVRDNLRRRKLKPKTKYYLNQVIEKSLDLVLHKHDFKEYLLICYYMDNDFNFTPVGFVIEKTGRERYGVKPV